MLWEKPRQESFYSFLYERNSEDYLLKRTAAAVEFSFINGLPSDSCCKNNGRPVKEPEQIIKHLAKRIFKAMHKDNGSMGKETDVRIPVYAQIAGPMEARQVLRKRKRLNTTIVVFRRFLFLNSLTLPDKPLAFHHSCYFNFFTFSH